MDGKKKVFCEKHNKQKIKFVTFYAAAIIEKNVNFCSLKMLLCFRDEIRQN